MKQKLQIKATVENPQMLESIVERLATRHYDTAVKTVVPKAWQALESSSVESYVSGTIDIKGKGLQPVHLPYTSSFLFSCTREKKEAYQLRWCISLS